MDALETYIAEAMRTPYRESVHDCCTFVTRWIDQQLGSSLTPPANSYKTVLEGLRAFAPLGIAARFECELSTLGLKPQKLPKAGAVAILDDGNVAIVSPSGLLVTPLNTKRGIICIHPDHAKVFYHVL